MQKNQPLHHRSPLQCMEEISGDAINCLLKCCLAVNRKNVCITVEQWSSRVVPTCPLFRGSSV